MPPITLADISAHDLLSKQNYWTHEIESLCSKINANTMHNHGIELDTLQFLMEASEEPSRPLVVTDTFLKEAISDLQQRIYTTGDIIKGIERSRDSLFQHRKDLHVAQIVIETLQDKPLYSFPPFPIDIGQRIIDFAVCLSPRIWHNLSLVSRQIQLWADRVFFQTLIFETSRHLLFLTDPPSLRYRTALAETTTLICDPSHLSDWDLHHSANIFSWLRHSPRLVNLALWYVTEDETPEFDFPPELRRLSCPTNYFQAISSQFGHHGLRHLTHLDIERTFDIERGFRGIEQLLLLTHFRLRDDDWERIGIDSIANQLVHYLPPKLVVAVFVFRYLGESSWRSIAGLAMGHTHPSFVVETTRPLDVPGAEWVSVIPLGQYFEKDLDVFGQGEGRGICWRQGEEIIRRRRADMSEVPTKGSSRVKFKSSYTVFLQ
ncbi:hypothetical protein DL96DRAFT_1585751 [Flagelloscypha sp. PMI_526]|nr:hypothetical protein DL96DRAFT_1585751 [Flagelloscypha sp. PMI_526]